jgi:hypothetical protein
MSTDDHDRPVPAEPGSTTALPQVPAGSAVTPVEPTLGAETRASRAAHMSERPLPIAPAPVPEKAPEEAPEVVAPEPTTVPEPAPDAANEPLPTRRGLPPEERVFPSTVPPRGVGFGGHVLGVLFGLILAPLSVLVAGLGESRIVLAYGPPRTAWIDGLGTTLVVLGAVLLIGVVILGLWTAAVPITGGAVVTALGLLYIVIPETTYRETLRLFKTDANALTVDQLAVQGVSGVVLLRGVLVLTAGIAIAIARSAGRRRGLLLAAANGGTRTD